MQESFGYLLWKEKEEQPQTEKAPPPCVMSKELSIFSKP